jgi:microcystin degradation protein MlrC
VPLVGTFDLHAKVTRYMVEQATALVGYHTAPHMQLFEAGQRAVRLFIETIARRLRPVTVLRRLPMLLPGENGRTT